MLRGVHHINFIVRDLAPAIPAWERILNCQVTARDRLESRGVDIARFDIGGTWIVLVQPTRPGTAPAEFLEKNGEGFFLMSLGVDSLNAASARVGADLLQGDRRDGLDDWVVQDLSIEQSFGVQLQYVESAGERNAGDAGQG